MYWISHYPLRAEKIQLLKRKYLFSVFIMPGTIPVGSCSSFMCIINAYFHVSPSTEGQCIQDQFLVNL